MLTFFLSTIFIVASLVSSYGWGRTIARLAYGNSNQQWAFLSALGLAFLIFLGGIINFIGIAYPGILYAIFFTGIIFSIIALFKGSFSNSLNLIGIHSKTFFDKFCFVLSIFIIVATSIFLIATLLPTNAFNIYDDFQTYLVRPFRMLQTGTIGGNNFDILGIDSLGGQSFLQAFILAVFPIEYVNGFDIIFCFVLIAFLLVGIAQVTKAHGLYLILAISTLILINPQIINIAALYSGSAMILGMIFASIILADYYNTKEKKSAFVRVIPFALFISALISLKFTLALFAIIYSVIYFLALLIFSKDKKNIMVTGIFLAVSVLFFLLPWIAIYRENYWYIIQGIFHENPQDIFANSYHSSRDFITKNWFSSDRLYWGGSFRGYNVLMLIMLMASLLSAYHLIKKKHSILNPYLIAIFVAGIAGIMSYFITAYFWDPDTHIRYSCSVIIAALPFTVLILGSQFGVFNPIVTGVKHKKVSSQYVMLSTMLLIFIILIGCFGNSVLERINLVHHKRTVLAFPLPLGYVGFNKTMLNNNTKKDVRIIQNKTEEGQTILAWTSIPFHLDFARNKILTVSEAGLCNPWLDLPLNSKLEDIRKFLNKRGIRYVILEYKGFAIKDEDGFRSYLRAPFLIYRKIASYNLYFRKMLIVLAKENLIIYNQNGIMIIDIG